MPPPMSKITLRSVVPIGTSMRPPFTTLPVSEKILVPLLVSVPMAAKASAPWLMIQGTYGVALDVVEVRRLAPEPVGGGADVLAPRHAPQPLDGGGESRGLAADEGPGALVDADVEVEARAQDVRCPAGRARRAWSSA